MAAIDDLIAQIDDPALRERLAQQVGELQRSRKFGLVFEEHLPELLPLYSAKPRRGDLVARRGGPLTETWLVLKVERDRVHGVKRGVKQADAFAIGDLVVVRQFGDPIFPSLVPVDRVQNGPAEGPWHTLIEADNYHALQLLEYLYAGQVDCIYIDPPYNTGARDWKYNNDYVDVNDAWRHSKWLAMMSRRLKIAKRLLRHDGVLIVTIDDYEAAHLDCVLEDLFVGWSRWIVTIEHNRRGRRGKNIAKSNEFAFFLVRDGLDVISEQMFQAGVPGGTRNLRRTGSGSLRHQRQRKFYPIYVDAEKLEIVQIGDPILLDKQRFNEVPRDIARKHSRRKLAVVWPVDEDGREKNWHYAHPRAQREAQAGNLAVRLQDYGPQVYFSLRDRESKKWKTVWTGPHLDASTHGTEFLERVLGRAQAFDFPKSTYATEQALLAAVLARPLGLVVDFFAGSGTTLNAVNLLNCKDSGRRRCILVTNNEVSSSEAANLSQAGHVPGDEEWEMQGVCRAVAWPRSKFTILGRRDDGSELLGEYLTGQAREIEKQRQFTHIGFLLANSLDTPAKWKQLVALIDGLPQSLVEDGCPFIVSEEHPVSVLFNETKAKEWLDALEGQDHVARFVIVAPTKRRFDELKAAVNDVLGPITVSEEVRRPLKEGFPANLEYLRLDFLDKDQVVLKRRFREILPLLWMRAGCVGPRPELAARKPEPPYFVRQGSNFAVLLDEMHFPKFRKALADRNDLSHVFLITDSHEAFGEMSSQIAAPNVIQLYRDYLENFMINKSGVA